MIKDKMTKRERVKAALNLEKTDRVPVYDILLNDAVIEYFTGKFPPTGEEGLKLKCQAISKMLDMTRMAGAAPGEPQDYINEDGFVESFGRWIGLGIKKRPFSTEEGAKVWLGKKIKELKEEMDFKKFTEDFRIGFNEISSYIGDDTVVLHRESGTGLDEIRAWLGLELFSYISVDEPGLISEYLELYTAREVKKIHAIADQRLSPCALTYGDIAYKDKLLHSPQWLRKEFFPKIERINDAWHGHNIKCLFHSDGYIMDIIPDLIESGINGLNPIETVAGMDLKETKRLYGDKLFLAGGIDISQLMANATPEKVKEVCEEAIAVASPGYFIGSTTELDNGSKLENILAMLEVAWGAHPDKIRM